VAEVYGELEGITKKHQIYARGWAKAMDRVAARAVTETVNKARFEAEAEANKQTRRRRVRPNDGEFFVTPEQIQEAEARGEWSRPGRQTRVQP
jgi:hypothetical protein